MKDFAIFCPFSALLLSHGARTVTEEQRRERAKDGEILHSRVSLAFSPDSPILSENFYKWYYSASCASVPLMDDLLQQASDLISQLPTGPAVRPALIRAFFVSLV